MTDEAAVTPLEHPRRSTLALFGSGDFAFNLYWQAINLYLLFFYIDALQLPPAVAGIVFMVGTVWDGAADFCAGAVAERTTVAYRRLVGLGAVPLGLAFVAMFAVPAGHALLALAAQIVFRTLYAFTNVPYAAWTTRAATTSAARATIAGWRIGFGAAAGALVAFALPVLVAGAGSYAAAAAVLALAGTPLLLVIAWRVPETRAEVGAPTLPATLHALALLVRNRFFVALNLAAALGGAAAALMGQSVLYFFRYVLDDAEGGARALTAMALVSVVAVPAWTWVARHRGARLAWLVAGALALVPPVVLALVAPGSIATAGFLLAMQAAFAGVWLAAWTLLPDAVDWGAAKNGERVEALAFGTFALAQKVALALAGFAIGAVYQYAGFRSGAPQGPGAITAIRWLMLAGPAVLVAAMLAAVFAIPHRRDACQASTNSPDTPSA
ncbi:MFS transporter [Sphingomonas sp. Mn802worker]|uniref:MFS transporter n=1 Tax=Sphingomonas sp. Mn802worker TaxID=629773 RepID=UPI0003A50A7F|nr:MFS transporter [Sphingomonas sp. Mn802worker]